MKHRFASKFVLLGLGLALYVIGLGDEGFGLKDAKDAGRTIIIIACVLIATGRRTAREDAAFRSGYDMGRSARRKEHRNERHKTRGVNVLPFQRSGGVAADDEAAHIKVSRDRGA